MATAGFTLSGSILGTGVSFSPAFAGDSEGNFGFALTGGIGAEGPLPGVSGTLTAGFYSQGTMRTLAGWSVEAGGSFYSPGLLGGEAAAVFDGTVKDLMSEGIGSIAQTTRGAVFDFGIGTPGGNAHVLQTTAVTFGFNWRKGELFACGEACRVVDLY